MRRLSLTVKGKLVRLEDVTKRVSVPPPGSGLSRIEGRSAVIAGVRLVPGADPVAACAAIRAELAHQQALLPAGARIDIIQDRSVPA
jgi:multidrug efflux pump subunit AcrB